MNDTHDFSTGGNSPWSRIISMLVLGFAYGVAAALLMALVIGQLLFWTLGKKQNHPLKRMGQQISNYIYQILMFLTFNSEHRPFPYQGWGETGDAPLTVQGHDRPGQP